MKSQLPDARMKSGATAFSSPMIRVVDRVKFFVPDFVKGLLSNCGGINRRRERFAGHLMDCTADDSYQAILHSLIFRNGVRKTTARNRNTEILEEIVRRGFLPGRPSLRVLDVGGGPGLDALSTCALLGQHFKIETYVLGDLFTSVFYDKRRGVIFDEDGNILQIACRRGFISVNFSYNYAFQRITNIHKRLHAKLRARRYVFNPEEVIRIPLVHPEVDVKSIDSVFRLRRMSVFEPLNGKFDLIICMHLLVRRYFSEVQIAQGIDNLVSALNVGGVMVAGSADTVTLITLQQDGELKKVQLKSTPRN